MPDRDWARASAEPATEQKAVAAQFAGQIGGPVRERLPSPETERPGRAATWWLLMLLAPSVWGSFRIVRSWFAARRVVLQSEEIAELRCRQLFEEIGGRLKDRRAANLRQSAQTPVPLCIGWMKPCVVLPPDWRSWPLETLRAVLAHELSHIVRGDVGWQLLARCTCALYWFHPLAWLAARRMRVEREAACDDAVLRLGEIPTAYARVLLNMAGRLYLPAYVPNAGLAMAARSGLEGRVRAILAKSRSRRPLGPNAARLLGLATLAAAIAASSLNPWSRDQRGAIAHAAGLDPTTAPRADDSPLKKNDAENAAQSHKVDAAATPAVKVRGRVVDEHDRPVKGAKVEAFVFPSHPSTLSADDGAFELTVSQEKARSLTIRATAANLSRQAFYQVESAEKLSTDITLVMRRARVVDVSVIDDQNRPVAGALVCGMVYWFETMAEARSDSAGKARLSLPVDAPLQYVLAGKSGSGLDYVVFRRPNEAAGDPYKLSADHHEPLRLVLNGARSLTVRVVDDRDKPMAGLTVTPWYFAKPKKGDILNGARGFDATTDQQGRALFDAIPLDNDQPITFWCHNDDYCPAERAVYDPKTESTEIKLTLMPRVLVRGRVNFADGRPAAGAEVYASGDGYRLDPFRGSARTREDGCFEMRVDPNQFYLFAAALDRRASPGHARVVRLRRPVDGIRLVLQGATRVHGRVTVGEERRAVADQYVTLHLEPDVEHLQLPQSKQLSNPHDDNKFLAPRITSSVLSSAKGDFEFFAGPGKYYITGPAGMQPMQFEVAGEPELEVSVHSDRPHRVEFGGRVVLKSNPEKVVAEVEVFGVGTGLGGFLSAVSNAEGKFRAERVPCEMVLLAQTTDKTMSGIIRIEPDDASCVIPIAPTTSARGRLVDGATGKVLSRRQIDYCARIDAQGMVSSPRFGGSVTSDEDGEFIIKGLVMGWDYDLKVVTERDAKGRPRGWTVAGSIKADSSEMEELGDVTVPPLLK